MSIRYTCSNISNPGQKPTHDRWACRSYLFHAVNGRWDCRSAPRLPILSVVRPVTPHSGSGALGRASAQYLYPMLQGVQDESKAFLHRLGTSRKVYNQGLLADYGRAPA